MKKIVIYIITFCTTLLLTCILLYVLFGRLRIKETVNDEYLKLIEQHEHLLNANDTILIGDALKDRLDSESFWLVNSAENPVELANISKQKIYFETSNEIRLQRTYRLEYPFDNICYIRAIADHSGLFDYELRFFLKTKDEIKEVTVNFEWKWFYWNIT